jgi:hypothetical protein
LFQESIDRGPFSSIGGEGMTKNRFFSGHLREIARLKVLQERWEEDQWQPPKYKRINGFAVKIYERSMSRRFVCREAV